MLGNPRKNVDNILFNKSRDERKEIYSQTKILLDLREQILKKLVNKKL